VNSIFTRPSDRGIITGGNDGKVIVWDVSFKKERTIAIGSSPEFSVLLPKIRGISEDSQGNKIVVSTRSSDIIEIEKNEKQKLVNSGHFDKELWGMASSPENQSFLSPAERTSWLRNGIIVAKKKVTSQKIPFSAKVCEVSPDGKTLAVGCCEWLHFAPVRCLISLKSSQNHRPIKRKFRKLKFSPDGSLLAIGAHDSRIRLYETKGWTLLSECKGHHSTVTHLDWSVDSKVLQSNSRDYELLYWNAVTPGSKLQAGLLPIEMSPGPLGRARSDGQCKASGRLLWMGLTSTGWLEAETDRLW
jgi:WD40 repeat protein